MSSSKFPPSSRYYSVDTAVRTGDDGKPVVYLKRRFIPQPDQYQLIEVHTVKDGERLDVITSQHLGDPEQFWRLCDANAAMHPLELTEKPGQQIRVTLPEGLPGQSEGE